jgi:hypothetical protein
MTGRTKISGISYHPVTDNLVYQYMCYANVYTIDEDGTDGSRRTGGDQSRVRIVERGVAIRGTVEDAMVQLAAGLDDKVEVVFGIGGIRRT